MGTLKIWINDIPYTSTRWINEVFFKELNMCDAYLKRMDKLCIFQTTGYTSVK